MYLKKYKIEKFLRDNPKSFFIAELLPMKQAAFIVLVQKFNKFGFKVKFFQAKAAGSILSQFPKALNIKASFKGNLVVIYPSDPSLDLGPLPFEDSKELLVLYLYYEGFFYHPEQLQKKNLILKNLLCSLEPTKRLYSILMKNMIVLPLLIATDCEYLKKFPQITK